MTTIENLENWFENKNKVMIALSGGVDSALVAYAAFQKLGKSAIAVTALLKPFIDSTKYGWGGLTSQGLILCREGQRYHEFGRHAVADYLCIPNNSPRACVPFPSGHSIGDSGRF